MSNNQAHLYHHFFNLQHGNKTMECNSMFIKHTLTWPGQRDLTFSDHGPASKSLFLVVLMALGSLRQDQRPSLKALCQVLALSAMEYTLLPRAPPPFVPDFKCYSKMLWKRILPSIGCTKVNERLGSITLNLTANQ